MKYEEILAEKSLELSPHQHAFINPYNGCSMGCPFCFWLSREGWEGRIQAKRNLPEILEADLKRWPSDEFLYLGSVCDPFNELEASYHLTRSCLELIEKYPVPLLITTSGVNPVLLQEASVLKRMKSRVILVVELARIPEIERMCKGGIHHGIENANRLYEMGLEVWTTLAPICPGVIELEPVLERLNAEIPIYVDSPQCTPDSIQGKRVMEWIRKDYPHLEKTYEDIVKNGNRSWFDEMLKTYETNKRIRTFPYDLSR